jgi:hypothetical protein
MLKETPFGELEHGPASAIRGYLSAGLKSEIQHEKLHFREPAFDARSPRHAVIGLTSELLTERESEGESNTIRIHSGSPPVVDDPVSPVE